MTHPVPPFHTGCPEPHDQPLGLTVYSLPTPQALGASARRTRMGRWQMLLVLLVCAAPVIAAYFAYYVVRPGSSSYGVLIEPQRALPDAVGTTLDGAPLALSALRGQWLLVSVAGGGCNAVCQNHLYLQRQLRESLGRDKERLDWVWLVAGDDPVPAALCPALRAATVLRVPPAVLHGWLVPAAGHALEDHLYLVDPQGRWMMRFPAQLDLRSATRARRDLQRLLRASPPWDRPAR